MREGETMGTNLRPDRRRRKQHRHRREPRPVVRHVPGALTAITLDQADRETLAKALRSIRRDRHAEQLLARIAWCPA